MYDYFRGETFHLVYIKENLNAKIGKQNGKEWKVTSTNKNTVLLGDDSVDKYSYRFLLFYDRGT